MAGLRIIRLSALGHHRLQYDQRAAPGGVPSLIRGCAVLPAPLGDRRLHIRPAAGGGVGNNGVFFKLRLPLNGGEFSAIIFPGGSVQVNGNGCKEQQLQSACNGLVLGCTMRTRIV